MIDDFSYAGIDTCAIDGLCATACPVNINTGDLTKRLRAESIKNEKPAWWIANHFALAEKTIGWSVSLGHVTEKMIGANGVRSISTVAEKISHTSLPKWNEHIPRPTKKLGISSAKKDFVYFPSCISRQLGQPRNKDYSSLSETLVTIARRANIQLSIADDAEGQCCGMPFSSKGYTAIYKATLHRTLVKFWEWSAHGKYLIVVDTTSCTHTLRTCKDDLSEEDREILEKLTILDSIEFLHDFVLPKLKTQVIDEEVVLHPNCSARKLGLDAKMLGIAKHCAKSATVPLNLGCCAFAGDRGLLFPELTQSAMEKESAEVNTREYDGYYSSNIPCEIGMSEATGKDYMSIVYLVERASRI
jgi:D-lactate dehydrogenase